jgi:prevent-host-death family protein
MNKISATEAQGRLDELLDSAYKEPVEITRKGQNVAVILAYDWSLD